MPSATKCVVDVDVFECAHVCVRTRSIRLDVCSDALHSNFCVLFQVLDYIYEFPLAVDVGNADDCQWMRNFASRLFSSLRDTYLP